MKYLDDIDDAYAGLDVLGNKFTSRQKMQNLLNHLQSSHADSYLVSHHLECPFCHPDNTLPNLVAATLPKQFLPFAIFWQMLTQIWQMLSNFLAKQV